MFVKKKKKLLRLQHILKYKKDISLTCPFCKPKNKINAPVYLLLVLQMFLC